MSATAKLFKNGRSQAVRLPKEFRMEGDVVRIRRVGNGVLLEPVIEKPSASDWDWVRKLREFGQLDDDFVAAVQEKMPQQERPEVDRFFAELDEKLRQSGE